jgi:hypothetical protein
MTRLTQEPVVRITPADAKRIVAMAQEVARG